MKFLKELGRELESLVCYFLIVTCYQNDLYVFQITKHFNELSLQHLASMCTLFLIMLIIAKINLIIK